MMISISEREFIEFVIEYMMKAQIKLIGEFAYYSECLNYYLSGAMDFDIINLYNFNEPIDMGMLGALGCALIDFFADGELSGLPTEAQMERATGFMDYYMEACGV